MTSFLHELQYDRYVYLIHAPQVGLVKIGSSRKPKIRLQAYKTHSPVEVVLLATILVEKGDEEMLHHVFREQRVRGEWFDDSIVAELLFYARWWSGGVELHADIRIDEPPEEPRMGEPWVVEWRQDEGFIHIPCIGTVPLPIDMHGCTVGSPPGPPLQNQRGAWS